MPNATMNCEEIVQTVKRSSLPTVLVEGKDDIYVYRELVDRIDPVFTSIIACGSRDVLLQVFRRRSEFSDKKVAFVADQDTYKYLGIPTSYSDVIFTSGYCMENDLYSGSRVDNVLMSADEKVTFNNIIEEICSWYAFEIGNIMSSKDFRTANHIDEVCPKRTGKLCTNFLQKINFTAPSSSQVDDLKSNYPENLRGKQIFQSMSRVLSAKDRYAKFNEKALIELSLKTPNDNLVRIESDIKSVLALS
ncbi:DUF4435 domain-containing protein [Vibrio splendidus]|uniref:DUF4435 domain-containing protein n=1 Tax=Vibrio splendidus TaxID=29497 RepID=UPI000D372CC5|nr:DUF4435 domain-containing protein [Vibrio splendidus]PTP56347.1 hypothetical protein CWO05_02200 [Vibrio splendidus]